MQTFELGKFLDDSLAEFKKMAQQKNIELTIITDFASSIMLKADAGKIDLLLNTIFKSSINYSIATSINFSIRQLVKSEKEIMLEFSLEDDGSFTQLHSKFSYLRSLAMAKSVIKELKGRSELILSPNGGMVLKFVICCSLATDIENVYPHYGFSFLKGKKILVVDDNDINQKTIFHILNTEGVECTIASNGRKAIELVEQNNAYDLIILDLLMPGMDGFETAAYIRKNLNDNTPILGLPARDKTWIPLLCKEVGIDRIIKKPFDVNDLLNLVNNMLAPVVHTSGLSLMKSA